MYGDINDILLIGAGAMAVEYANVLLSLHKEFTVVGRGEKSAELFEKKTNHKVIRGGLENFLKEFNDISPNAIVSVTVDQLAVITIALIKKGVKKILVEKPGGVNFAEIQEVNKVAMENNSEIYIAYNRRFYSSTFKALEIIKEDGGVTSFHFEFTEWSHIIEKLNYPRLIKENLVLANSSHVIDLAFYLGGKPKEMKSYISGGLNWHTSASIFVGAGICENGALFSYYANWEAPGRWSVELLTKKHRLILRPLESLQIQKIGSISIEPVLLEDQLDKNFKPGLYLQTKAFLENDLINLCSIEKQADAVDYYSKIGGYRS